MSKNNTKNKKSGDYYETIILVSVVIIAILFIALPHNVIEGDYGNYYIQLDKYEGFATFLGLPIGLISLLLIFFTYRSQKIELRETSDTLKSQNETSNIQKFENSFYKLIDLKNYSLNQIIFNKYTGQYAIHEFMVVYYSHVAHNKRRVDLKLSHDKILKQCYDHFLREQEKHYFQLLNSILTTIDYIEGAGLTNEAKQMYYSIYSSQFTKAELKLLIYYKICTSNSIYYWKNEGKDIIESLRVKDILTEDQFATNDCYKLIF